jgi:adenylate kinase
LKKQKSIDFVYTNFGTIMLKLGIKRNIVKDRDAIRKLDIGLQKELQLLTAVEIQEINANLLVVDTHCTVKTPAGFFPGFPKSVLEQLDPDAIIIVEADPHEIAERRNKDKGRDRDIESPAMVEEHQQMNRIAAMSYGTTLGIPVLIVKNPAGGADKAAKKIAQIIKTLI